MSALARRQLDLDLAHPVDHFKRLHADAHGTVILWEKQAANKRWTKLRPGDPAVPEMLSAHAGQVDRFMTVNEFYNWRVVRQLKSLRACYVDVDDPTVTIDEVLDSVDAGGVPRPTFAVMSGRGMHLYWQIEPAPHKALPVWQRLQKELGNVVRGADKNARDCARVLRMVGSVHGESQRDVRGVVLGQPWTLHTLADEVLGARNSLSEIRDISAARARRGRRPLTSTGSIYEWWYCVYRDIVAIGDYHRRTSGGIRETYRDQWLHLYGVALAWFAEPDTLVDELAMAARTWTHDLSQAEVRDALACTLKRAVQARNGETIEWCGQRRDPRYWYKRETLHDKLSPLIPDELAGRLRAVIPDGVAVQRRQERDRARFDDHYTGKGVRASNVARRAEALEMRAAGKSTHDIAEALGVNQSTVVRWGVKPR